MIPLEQDILKKKLVEELKQKQQQETTINLQDTQQTQQTLQEEETLTIHPQQEIMLEEFGVTIPETTATVQKEPKVKKLNSKSKRKSYLKEQTKKTESGKMGIMSDVEEEQAKEYLERVKGDSVSWFGDSVETVYNDVLIKNDYSQFEKLPIPLRNQLATQYMKMTFLPMYSHMSEEKRAEYVRNLSTEGILNPLFRLGISLAMNGGIADDNTSFPGEYFRQLDNQLSSRIMQLTLTTVHSLDSMTRNGLTKEECDRDTGGRIFVAKNLMLAHLGKLNKVGKTGSRKVEPGNDERVPWEEQVTTAFIHCSRVQYIFPSMEKGTDEELKKQRKEHQQMWDSFYSLSRTGYNDDGLSGSNGGMAYRFTSTHDIERRTVKKPAKEKKAKFNFSGQMGINIALGGLGRKGASGKTIKGDGRNTHVYNMKKDADVGVNGGYLVGFESDAAYKTNQLGHTHDIFATGEKASGFGSQRSDEVGAKYGGREVDLSDFTPDEIVAQMENLETVMRFLSHKLSAGPNPTWQMMLDDIVESLTGHLMNFEQMNDLQLHIKSICTNNNLPYKKVPIVEVALEKGLEDLLDEEEVEETEEVKEVEEQPKQQKKPPKPLPKIPKKKEGE